MSMEYIIELWQQASVDESSMDRRYASKDLVPVIMQLEKKQQRLLRFKTLSIAILLPALLIVFLNKSPLTLNSMLGIGIFFISVITVVVLLNRLRFQVTYEERSLSTLQLLSIAEKRIHNERKAFTIYLPLFAILALLGFNLMYLDLFTDEDALTRLFYHLVMSGSLALAFAAGLSIRIRRFRRQFLPVLERIRCFRDASD